MFYPSQNYSYKLVCANVDWNIGFVLWTWHLVTNHYQRLGSRKDLGEWNINLKSRPFGKIALTSHLLGVSSTKFIQCWTGKTCSDWYAMTWYDYPRGEFYFTRGANMAKQVSQVEILHHNHPTISDNVGGREMFTGVPWSSYPSSGSYSQWVTCINYVRVGWKWSLRLTCSTSRNKNWFKKDSRYLKPTVFPVVNN